MATFRSSFCVFGQINLAHSACADLFDYFVMPETFSRFRVFLFQLQSFCNFGDGGRFHKTFGTVVR